MTRTMMPVRPDQRTLVHAVVIPALAVVTALVGRAVLEPALRGTLPLVTLYGAVALAQWFGGWRSAAGVAVCGYLGAHFWFVPPRLSWSFGDKSVLVGSAAYAVTCGLLIAFGYLAERAQEALHASEHALADRVRELDASVEASREREAIFRTIGEAVPDFLWLADADGQPVYQNPALTHYTGLTTEAFRQADWQSLHLPEDVPALQHAWGVAAEHGEPFSIDVRLRRRDGAFRWFHCRTVPLRDDAGIVRTWVGTMTDIHELKRAEEQLAEAAQRKDEFLALLSHELRNPLAPLRSALDVLRLQPAPSEATAHLYGIMERQLGQLVRLVDDLLEISRISSGTLTLRREPVTVQRIVASAVEMTRPMMQRAGHVLTQSVDEPDVVVNGDPVRLAQILTNLLTNAIRYTPDGGRIHVATRTSDASVAIGVTDNGVGIPAGELPHVFEMFTRGRQTMLQRDGLGVGLALAAQLADLHGGRIDVRSGGPGQGSTFTLTLPCARIAASAANTTVLTLPDHTSHRILVVDDNADAAESLALLLRHLGAHVSVAWSGRAALTILDTVRPSLVLLDLGMPEMDGFEVLDAMRARDGGEQLQVVAVTGWGQERDRVRVAEAGFDGHLVKPVDLATLDGVLS